MATTADTAAIAGLVRAAGGSLLVLDVTAEPTPDAPAVRTAKCGCCGKRRDLVAFTSPTATDADLCFRCGSDRAQGLGYCSSAPRTYTQTFSDSDWDAPA